MDNILSHIDVHNCTGCGMCMRICITSAVLMNEDTDGFAYPVIDDGLCKGCGLCVKVCPLFNNENNSEKSDFATGSKCN